jgi:hypothetical protein
MNEQSRPDGADAISADDAERLFAVADPDSDGSPTLVMLHELFTAARAAGDDSELAQKAQVVALFSAERLAARELAPQSDHRLKAITRRTLAILGIATGASLGAALAVGAVGNPFTSPAPVDRAPETTSLLRSVAEPMPTTVGEPSSVDDISVAPPSVITSVVDRLSPRSTTSTQPPVPGTIGAPTGVDPSAGAPVLTPSVTAPG